MEINVKTMDVIYEASPERLRPNETFTLVKLKDKKRVRSVDSLKFKANDFFLVDDKKFEEKIGLIGFLWSDTYKEQLPSMT